jgi:AcrR family transcriptional regulator
VAIRKRDFKQERARRTYEAILRAAAKLFPKRGFDGAQVPDIAKAAGVSTGAVYRYFTDKREIFLEMLELHLDEARAEVDARMKARNFQSPDAIVEAVVDEIFAQTRRDPALARIYLSMSFTDRDVGALRARTEAADRDAVALLVSALPRERIPDPNAAAVVIQSAALAAAIECGVFRSADEKEVKPAVVTAISRYLFGP